jgi:hypothetical protein
LKSFIGYLAQVIGVKNTAGAAESTGGGTSVKGRITV